MSSEDSPVMEHDEIPPLARYEPRHQRDLFIYENLREDEQYFKEDLEHIQLVTDHDYLMDLHRKLRTSYIILKVDAGGLSDDELAHLKRVCLRMRDKIDQLRRSLDERARILEERGLPRRRVGID
ncbi:hypothetical protein LTR66_002376 [Elasticomyces elasticus]|nr:hypothetical protein LTR66_002376 [Elasticomyces elasticus]KAK5011605.1 hypothetical protein LTR28_012080 [Elasticomyces elasticus]